MKLFFLILAFFIYFSNFAKSLDDLVHTAHPLWLINLPSEVIDRTAKLGSLTDVRSNKTAISQFEFITDYFLVRTDAFTDGEVVDALEHFFWGKSDGLAMELGALDGSPNTRSMTTEYERLLNWKRILVEGDPRYRNSLKSNSPMAMSVNTAICERHSSVHFRPVEYVGGILEFMSESFLKQYHNEIYVAGTPPGNVSSVDWSKFGEGVLLVDCMPLSHILHRAKAFHINYFILDVEGGEYEVLSSIDWSSTTFDVLCVETEPANRPEGFREKIVSYLAERGYEDASGQQGRNTWFLRKGFEPSSRPGLDPKCFNGVRKSEREDAWWLNRRTPAFQKCPIN